MRAVVLPRLRRFARRALPWISCAAGVTSAIIMDRGHHRAPLVAGVAIGAWALLLAVLLLRRIEEHRLDHRRARLLAGIRFSSLALTQWAIQLSLFFALPFFWRAWGGTPEQVAFLVVLSLAALVSLWDPLTEHLLTRSALAPVLPGLASFAGLVAVLPGVGVSNSTSLWIAAGATAVALPVALIRPRDDAGPRRGRTIAAVLGVAVLLVASIPLGGARFVPPAPLALIDAEIGTHQEGRGVADPVDRLERRPGLLICATSIWAPLGVNERLYHVWRQDGHERDRIELEVQGGRRGGFRTWSKKRRFGPEPGGRWTCTVETALGQQLGRRAVDVEPRGD